jgi:hypothetical protein
MFWRRLPQDRSSTGAQKTMPRNVLYYPELESKCTSMGHHARQFLSVWEFEHIKGVARTNRQEQARLLAEKCRDDAAKAGINKWALEIAAGGDLIRKLTER